MNSTEKNKTYPQMEQPMAVRESCEKRKITSIDGEKLPHFGKNSQKISREEKSRLLNLASQTGLVCYVKAL